MNRQKALLVVGVIVTLAITLPLVLSCDPAIPLKIENRTDMVLTIYVQSVNDGDVKPNNTIKIKDVPSTLSYFLIEAKNSKGETVYSRNISTTELHDADWKVVILPLQNK